MSKGIMYDGQGPFESEESLRRWIDAQEELEAKQALPPLSEKEKALGEYMIMRQGEARRRRRGAP